MVNRVNNKYTSLIEGLINGDLTPQSWQDSGPYGSTELQDVMEKLPLLHQYQSIAKDLQSSPTPYSDILNPVDTSGIDNLARKAANSNKFRDFKNALSQSSTLSGLLNTGANAVGDAIGQGIAGGRESGVGNAIGSVTGVLGSAVSKANPLLGAAVTGAGKLLGGVTNAAFGTKWNDANISTVENNISRLNNFQSNANSYDTLAQTWNSTQFANNFSDDYIGKQGWLRSNVSDRAEDLREQQREANNFAYRSLEGNAMNIRNKTLSGLEQGYMGAYGGFLHAFGGNLDTAGTDFPTGLTFINNGGTHESSPYEGVPMGIGENGKPNLVEEGEVVYNDYVFSNRLTVPKAIRSKYKLRGNKDLTFADAVKQLSKGATERPNDPISRETLHEIMFDLAQTQEGVREEAQQGNRFDNGGFTYKPYKYVAGYNGGWFDSDGKYTQSYLDKVNNMGIADINNAFNEQYKFYTNDANKGTDRWKAIDAFYTANPQYKTASTNLTDAALPTIRSLATDGNPGFMHQFFNDANPINRANRYFLRGRDSSGTPIVTPMSVTPWEGLNDKGQTFKEAFPNYVSVGKQERPIDKGTIYTDYYYDENKPVIEGEKDIPPIDLGTSNESLRYAPVFGLGLASLTDAIGLTNKPDYGEASMIEAATRGGSYMPVSWNSIGNKLTYRPFDRDYYTNKLNAEASATRRALANQSGGNSGRAIAGILAADYNAQDKLGDLFRKSEEYNLEQRQKVEDFNRATNQANSQGMLQADMANQNASASARDFSLRGTMAAAEMRQKARLAAEQARSANLSGFLQALGDIGYENKGMNMIRRLAETGALGAISEGHPLYRYLTTSKGKPKSSTKKNK